MEHTLFCCNLEQPCKVYNLPSKKLWKRLFFLDRCALCSQTIAAIWECSMDGTLKLITRKTGEKAINLRNKIISKKMKEFTVLSGTFSNEIVYYNNRGNIYNFNNRKVASQEKFLLNIHS